MSRSIDMLRLTVIVTSCIIPALFLWAPMLAQAFQTQLHLSPGTIGRLFSIDMLISPLPGLLMFLWQKHIGWRHVATLCAVIFAGGSILSAVLLGHGLINWFYLCRIPTAMASGTLYVMCNRSVARFDDPDRLFGVMLTSQVVVATLGLLVLPSLFARFGVGVPYVVQALWVLALVPLYRYFPDAPPHGASVPATAFVTGGTGIMLAGIMSVGALFIFNIATGAVWTFASVFLQAGGMTSAGIDHMLALVGMMGIVGSGSAALAASGKRRMALLLGGYALLLLSLFGLGWGHSPAVAAGALVAFKLSWTFLLPFMLGSITLLDTSGVLMNVTTMTLGVSLGLGAVVAGWLLDHAGQAVMLTGMAACSLVAATASVIVAGRAGPGRPSRAARHQVAEAEASCSGL